MDYFWADLVHWAVEMEMEMVTVTVMEILVEIVTAVLRCLVQVREETMAAAWPLIMRLLKIHRTV